MTTTPKESSTSDHLYVSGTFWLTVALIVVTLALGWFAWRTLVIARNRRTLRWSQTVVPMVRNDHRLTGELVVMWQGKPIDHPAIATVRLENASKTDIGTVSFDGGRPVVVSFNANVLALLEPEATEKDGLLPVRLSGNTVEVGPGLLRHGGTLNISALVDSGATVSIAVPLENVNVQEQPRATIESSLTVEFGAFGFRFRARERLTAFVSILATIIAAVASAITAAFAFKK